MRRVLVIALLCISFACLGFAQADPNAPATKEDVLKYLEVVHARDMTRQMVGAMSKPMHQLIHEQYMKNKEKLPSDFEERMGDVMDDMLKQMPWDEIMDSMIPIYEKHLSKGDIDAMVTFYSSASGQKILKEMPAISAEAMQNMMPLLSKYMESMNAKLQQQMQDMAKNAASKPADAASSPK